MNIAQLALDRRTCKAYDPTRKIPADQFAQIKTLLRFAPSSVNSQPWHFFIAESEAAKARLAKAAQPGTPYAANNAKITQASHVIALCARNRMDVSYHERLLAQEAQDGRFPTPEGREMQHKGRSYYLGLHGEQLQDLPQWTQKQVYLALGTLLLGAAALGIDATPIEGFDAALLDAELGLPEQGLNSVVLLALGYRSEQDFNAGLPKSRWPEETIITEL